MNTSVSTPVHAAHSDHSVPRNSGFPSGFLWGSATAAYQIEGSHQSDGKGASIWDMMSRKEGAILGDATGDVACDHYKRFREDVSMMKEIGLQAYRFSIAWSRIFPDGTGRVNQAGLDFYSALVDELLASGIEPFVTLYHWDLPLALHHRGGWMNREIKDWFADFATVVGRHLGDRVKWWMTLNEPSVFIVGGYREGNHAPGIQLSVSECLRCMHHTLLAHGTSTLALRAACSQSVKIGTAAAGYSKIPDTDSPADIEAARRSLFSVKGQTLWGESLWLDPVYLGKYADEAPEIFGSKWHNPSDEDLRIIHQPQDFMGSNCYSGMRVRAGEVAGGSGVSVTSLGGGHAATPAAAGEIPHAHEHPTGQLPWLRVAPEALYWKARFYNERYGHGRLPFVVTENGFASSDWIALDGRIHDAARIDYVHSYLRELRRAADEGIPLGGYFYWSLMDNFEWAEGYKPRFGIVYVDYATQKRTLKDSAHWYRDVIKTHGANL